jgi:hypothetical protein
MAIRGFPFLLLEVASDQAKERDLNRMLLQASCLVRLGNSLFKSEDNTSHFLVKAIYLDTYFHAREYTLYQRRAHKAEVFISLLSRD